MDNEIKELTILSLGMHINVFKRLRERIEALKKNNGNQLTKSQLMVDENIDNVIRDLEEKVIYLRHPNASLEEIKLDGMAICSRVDIISKIVLDWERGIDKPLSDYESDFVVDYSTAPYIPGDEESPRQPQ